MNERPEADRTEKRGGEAVSNDMSQAETGRRREIGGRDGPDPTRYGDWEKAGRCIDF